MTSLCYLGWRHNGEGDHDAVWILFSDLADEQRPHSRSGTSAERVSQLESLQTVAALRLLADNIENRVDQLSALCVVTFGPVIASSALTYIPKSFNWNSNQALLTLNRWHLPVTSPTLLFCNLDFAQYAPTFNWITVALSPCYLHLATFEMWCWPGGRDVLAELSLSYITVYYYNGARRYEQFLQVGRLYQALILLGLALSLIFQAPLHLWSSWCYRLYI